MLHWTMYLIKRNKIIYLQWGNVNDCSSTVHTEQHEHLNPKQYFQERTKMCTNSLFTLSDIVLLHSVLSNSAVFVTVFIDIAFPI